MMDKLIQDALDRDDNIDITTIGRKSGRPQRLEIWFKRVNGRTYITGTPGRRDWYANLLVNPRFTFHLKQSLQAELPARAVPITNEAERRRILADPTMAWYWSQVNSLDDLVAGSPLVEVIFEEQTTEPPAENMVWIPGGEFLMGSDGFYPEERPARRVSVDGFWMDRYTVTVAEFRRFVEATGYITVAERPLNPADYPDADPALLVPGSLVFQRANGPVDLRNYHNWWAYVPGASWRHPEGPGSDIDGRDHHPVTHVAYEDAETYAHWAGKELPTEAEWEYAARGGLEGAMYAWGDEFAPGGRLMANTWQGEFPWQNLRLDGYEGTAPVGSYPPNGYGLYDMGGNVWQWTSDYFTIHQPGEATHHCCAPHNPRVVTPERDTFAVGEPGANIPRRVLKGGSHLCAPNYCLRYRPAARQAEMVDTSTTHIGFRCVVRPSN